MNCSQRLPPGKSLQNPQLGPLKEGWQLCPCTQKGMPNATDLFNKTPWFLLSFLLLVNPTRAGSHYQEGIWLDKRTPNTLPSSPFPLQISWGCHKDREGWRGFWPIFSYEKFSAKVEKNLQRTPVDPPPIFPTYLSLYPFMIPSQLLCILKWIVDINIHLLSTSACIH